MGMSASQGRLLSLTARLSDLELKAQTIQNAKIRLADQSEGVQTTYLNALKAQKMTVKTGSSTIDATAANITSYGAISGDLKQRFLKVASSGQVIVSDKVNKAYNAASPVQLDGKDATVGQFKTKYPSAASYLKENLGYSTEAEAKAANVTYSADSVTQYTTEYNSVVNTFLKGCGVETDSSASGYDASASKYYTNELNEIAESGGCVAPGDSNLNSGEWLQEQIDSNSILLSEYNSTGGSDGTGDFVNVSWDSGDSSLVEASDTKDVAVAEAEYNVTLSRIQSKDKIFDMQLTSINTEHTATQTEIDSVKKVIDKNIERSYKIFDA